jgi:amino acid permease
MYVSCRLLLACKNYTKKKDFSKISLALLGRFGLITHISIFINNFGMSIAFLIVGVDTYKTMLEVTVFTKKTAALATGIPTDST